MEIIPAIDLKDGKVVNLKQGRFSESTQYSDDPVQMAAQWVSQGASRLHLVDLDGAVQGHPVNKQVVAEIARNHPDLVLQLGGGIRSAAIIGEYLSAGVDYLVLGTKAVDEPEFVGEMCRLYPGHILVGLDALNGKLAKNAWREITDIDTKSLALIFQSDGIEGIIYTDIGKDGMMQGLNLAATQDLANSVSVPVIASGGVTNIQDIHLLLANNPPVEGGIKGVITGRALYEGTLNLAEAIAACSAAKSS